MSFSQEPFVATVTLSYFVPGDGTHNLTILDTVSIGNKDYTSGSFSVNTGSCPGAYWEGASILVRSATEWVVPSGHAADMIIDVIGGTGFQAIPNLPYPVTKVNFTAARVETLAILPHVADAIELTVSWSWNPTSPYILTPTVSGPGTTVPSDAQYVITGARYSVSAIPDTDCTLDTFTLNGEDITNPYSFIASAQNYALIAVFSPSQIRIDHWIEGEGTIDSPASGFTDPGEYVVAVTPAEGYHLVSLDVDGTDIESGGTFNFSDDKTVWQIHAVFEPDKISLTVTVTSSGTDCAPSGEFIDGHVWIFPVNLGAYVYTAPLWVTVGSEGGTDTQTDAEAYDYGDPVFISAQCSDIRNRLASLTVNGDEKILPGELTTGYIMAMTATTAITIVATFTADAPCFIPQFPPPGTGGTPPSGPTPPIVPVPTNPPTEPPGTPPFPPPPAPPPGGGGDSGGGSGGGQYYEGVPKEDGGGEPPDFGPTRIFPPGWDRQTDMARMWIRWRDDNGEWSKEHPVDIGSPGDNEWPVWMPMRGDYSTRQWEIVITDRAPLVVVYLEEEVDGLDE